MGKAIEVALLLFLSSGVALSKVTVGEAAGPLARSTPVAQKAAPSPSAPLPAVLDINTATADQLKVLPGMGQEYARRIIAGRPYSAKNQLVSRGVIPQSAYDRIAGRIIAHRPK